MSIYVTKTFLPPYEEYCRLLTKIWDTSVVTNQGPYVHELEQKIQKLLNLEHFQYVGNGTVALQLALSALDIHDGEIITTPFSYVATTGSILWERCTPVFADIEPDNFTANYPLLRSVFLFSTDQFSTLSRSSDLLHSDH